MPHPLLPSFLLFFSNALSHIKHNHTQTQTSPVRLFNIAFIKCSFRLALERLNEQPTEKRGGDPLLLHSPSLSDKGVILWGLWDMCMSEHVSVGVSVYTRVRMCMYMLKKKRVIFMD